MSEARRVRAAYGLGCFGTDLYWHGTSFFLLFYYSALFIDRDRQKVEWTTQHLPQYNKAVARWEHLSYCQRCDVVWLDNEPGRLTEVEDTEKLLNA